MGRIQRQLMHSDFVRWCELRAKIAYANNEYEMASLINHANRIEERWANGSYAAQWFRLQGRSPHYVAHISCEPSEPSRGLLTTVETHPATDLIEALAWSKFRLEHIGDTQLHFSINRTGSKKPVYDAHGSVGHVVDEVLQWQRDQEKRPA